jgi:small-conductance mechanosensitive channel
MLDQLASWISSFFDNWNSGPAFLGLTSGQWGAIAATACTGWFIGYLFRWPVRFVLRWLRKRVPSVVWSDDVEHRLTTPIMLFSIALALRAGIEVVKSDDKRLQLSGMACSFAVIIFATLIAVRLVGVGKEYLQAMLVGRTHDAAKIRSIKTRVTIPARIVQFLIWVIGIALALLQFHAVQEIGVSLLASAGVVSVILGLAAQRTFGNILAGLQLAFAEPVRIGDTVVVEGEFGVVEEINLTIVVVKVWDQHRLILPVNYFVEKPFQNWTRGSSEITGSVMVQADFTVPVKEIRTELDRILKATDLWDGNTHSLQVTELSGNRVELRALVSATDSSRLWDLRCHVREHLLTWLQSHGQHHLPVQRIETVANNINGNGKETAQK